MDFKRRRRAPPAYCFQARSRARCSAPTIWF